MISIAMGGMQACKYYNVDQHAHNQASAYWSCILLMSMTSSLGEYSPYLPIYPLLFPREVRGGNNSPTICLPTGFNHLSFPYLSFLLFPRMLSFPTREYIMKRMQCLLSLMTYKGYNPAYLSIESYLQYEWITCLTQHRSISMFLSFMTYLVKVPFLHDLSRLTTSPFLPTSQLNFHDQVGYIYIR